MTKTEKTRQNILRAAYLVMEEKEKIPTMREIAAEAGKGLGSVYYHFETNDQIFIELDGKNFDYIQNVIKGKTDDSDDPLFLFMAVETFRTLLTLSKNFYRQLFLSMPLGINFSPRRLLRLEKTLKAVSGNARDYDVYLYQGLYTAFYAKAVNTDDEFSVYDGMQRIFLIMFGDSLEERELADIFLRVKKLGKVIQLKELMHPWTHSGKAVGHDEIDSRPIGSFAEG